MDKWDASTAYGVGGPVEQVASSSASAAVSVYKTIPGLPGNDDEDASSRLASLSEALSSLSSVSMVLPTPANFIAAVGLTAFSGVFSIWSGTKAKKEVSNEELQTKMNEKFEEVFKKIATVGQKVDLLQASVDR